MEKCLFNNLFAAYLSTEAPYTKARSKVRLFHRSIKNVNENPCHEIMYIYLNYA